MRLKYDGGAELFHGRSLELADVDQVGVADLVLTVGVAHAQPAA